MPFSTSKSASFLSAFLTIAILATTVASVSLLPPIQKAQADITTGLVGHWTFDGTANDSAGTNHGTLVGGPTYAAGKLGQALNFDGVDDSVNVGSAATLDDMFASSGGTLSIWVNPRSMGEANDGFIFGKQDGSATVAGWSLRFTASGGGQNRLLFTQEYATTNLTRRSNDNSLNLNEWQHVVVTWDGSANASNVHIYRDGVEVTYNLTTNGEGNFGSDAAQPLIIGNNNAGGRTWDGLIDDVRIYNRALSEQEIKRLHKIGEGTKAGVTRTIVEDGLVGHWTFDGEDIYGTTALDRSGQGNDGTITNGTRSVKGRLGQALEFDGSDDYIAGPDSDSLTITGDLAIGAWVWRDTSTTDDFITTYTVAAESEETNTLYEFLLLASANNLRMKWESGGGTDTVVTSSVGVSTPTGSWAHYMIVRDTTAKTVTFYEDGQVLGSVQSYATNPTGGTSSSLFIGADIDGASGLDGKLDDLRIYNRALTPDEIQRIYTGTKASHVNAAETTGSLEDGLVGHWSFDGNFTGPTWTDDVSGNDNRGTLVNGPRPVKGPLGQALEFDGVDDALIEVNQNFENSLSSFSVAMWIKTDNFGDNDNGLFSSLNGDNLYPRARLTLNGDIFFQARINGSQDSVTLNQINLNLNTWHHVVLTFNSAGNIVSGFKDGVFIQSGDLDDGVLDGGSANLLIGEFQTNISGDTFYGLMDDFRVYNRLLTPEEIKRLYVLGK